MIFIFYLYLYSKSLFYLILNHVAERNGENIVLENKGPVQFENELDAIDFQFSYERNFIGSRNICDYDDNAGEIINRNKIIPFVIQPSVFWYRVDFAESKRNCLLVCEGMY